MDWSHVASSGVSGLLSGVFGSFASNRAYQEQKEMQLRDQAFQREMFDKANEWNKPAHMAQLMQEGGFSPSALYGSNGQQGSAQMPVAGSHSATPAFTEAESNPLLGVSTIAQAIAALTQSGKNVAETETLQSMLEKKLKQMDLQNEAQDLQNALTKVYGNKKASNEVAEQVARIAQLASVTELSSQQSKTELAKRANIDMDTLLKSAQRDLSKAEFSKLKIELEVYREQLLAQIDNLKASSTQMRSSAANLDSQTVAQDLVNNINKATNLYDIDNAIYNADVLKLLGQSTDKERAFQELVRSVKVSKAYKDGDLAKDIDAVLENLARLIGLNVSLHN